MMGGLPPCCQGVTTSVSSSLMPGGDLQQMVLTCCAREMLLFIAGFLGWEQVWVGSAHPDPFGRVGSSTEGPYPEFRASQH